MAYLALAARVLVGVVFAVAAGAKLRAFEPFTASIAAMALVPRSLTRLTARLVLAGEIVVVASLAVGVRPVTVAGFGLALLLDTAFTIGIAHTVRAGIDARCRCFGAAQRRLGVPHLVRDALLGIVIIAGAWAGSTVTSAGQPLGWVLATCAGGVGAIVVVYLDDMIALFRSSPAPTPRPPTPATRTATATSAREM